MTSKFDGTYEVIIPEGDYNAYSQVISDGIENVVSLQGLGTVNGNSENVNLSTSRGHDAWIILYEEHMDEMMGVDTNILVIKHHGTLEV